MSWNHKLFTGYIALMVVATVASLCLPLLVALLLSFETLDPLLRSEPFARGAYVAMWVLSGLVACVYMASVYIVDDAGIRKRQLLGGWFISRDDIAEATVEPGTFNSHLKLVLRDRRTKAFVMTPSMVLAIQAELGTNRK